ncbi:hypothetical protein MC885_008408 [Smutsia gigantea]|nr:hypothetical protein MC885_008408 [Smutsia gigantea]
MGQQGNNGGASGVVFQNVCRVGYVGEGGWVVIDVRHLQQNDHDVHAGGARSDRVTPVQSHEKEVVNGLLLAVQCALQHQLRILIPVNSASHVQGEVEYVKSHQAQRALSAELLPVYPARGDQASAPRVQGKELRPTSGDDAHSALRQLPGFQTQVLGDVTHKGAFVNLFWHRIAHLPSSGFPQGHQKKVQQDQSPAMWHHCLQSRHFSSVAVFSQRQIAASTAGFQSFNTPGLVLLEFTGPTGTTLAAEERARRVGLGEDHVALPRVRSEGDLVGIGLQESPHPVHAHKGRGPHAHQPAAHGRQQTRRVPAPQPEGQQHDDKGEEDAGDRGHRHHQVQREAGGVRVRWGLHAVQVGQDVWDAVGHGHRERDGGRERGLAVVLDRHHQALLERVSVQQGPRCAHLACVQPHHEEPWLAGLEQAVGQPGVLARVSVHRHHLGHQVAGLCGAGCQLHACGPVGGVGGVQDLWGVVVLVQHKQAQGHVAAERRVPAVTNYHSQLQVLQLLIVEGLQGIQDAGKSFILSSTKMLKLTRHGTL